MVFRRDAAVRWFRGLGPRFRSASINGFLAVLCAHNDDLLSDYTGENLKSSGRPVVMRALTPARLTRCAGRLGSPSSLCAETTANTTLYAINEFRRLSPRTPHGLPRLPGVGSVTDKSWRLQNV